MMNKMKGPEYLRVMHEAVREIKISIVQQEHDGEGQPEPQAAVCIDIPVVLCVLPERC